MKNINVYRDNNEIQYPQDYLKCIDDKCLEDRINALNMDMGYVNKNTKKIINKIINKNKDGKYIYIKGYAIKQWKRFGYNHYSTKIKDEKFTIICSGDYFGYDIPKHILEMVINDIYKNINSLKNEELEEYYENILVTGFEYNYQTCYDRKSCIIDDIIDFTRLYNYLDYGVKISYNEFKLPKKRGGYRTIVSPNEQLKEVQRLILDSVLKNMEISSCATGFIEGKSIVDNAYKHTGKKFVLNIDLDNFFNTIGTFRVYSMFISMGYQHSHAEKMTNICTYNGYLPQGAPTSPYISNIICNNLDRRLYKLAKELKGNYTRYADDITISTNNMEIKKYINTIEKIIIEEGFKINYKKYRLLTNNTKQIVTGIVVNEKLNIDKEYIRKIRQELYYCNKYGIREHMLHENINLDEEHYLQILKGKINFIKSINTKIGYELEHSIKLLTKNG